MTLVHHLKRHNWLFQTHYGKRFTEKKCIKWADYCLNMNKPPPWINVLKCLHFAKLTGLRFKAASYEVRWLFYWLVLSKEIFARKHYNAHRNVHVQPAHRLSQQCFGGGNGGLTVLSQANKRRAMCGMYITNQRAATVRCVTRHFFSYAATLPLTEPFSIFVAVRVNITLNTPRSF